MAKVRAYRLGDTEKGARWLATVVNDKEARIFCRAEGGTVFSVALPTWVVEKFAMEIALERAKEKSS